MNINTSYVAKHENSKSSAKCAFFKSTSIDSIVQPPTFPYWSNSKTYTRRGSRKLITIISDPFTPTWGLLERSCAHDLFCCEPKHHCNLNDITVWNMSTLYSLPMREKGKQYNGYVWGAENQNSQFTPTDNEIEIVDVLICGRFYDNLLIFWTFYLRKGLFFLDLLFLYWRVFILSLWCMSTFRNCWTALHYWRSLSIVRDIIKNAIVLLRIVIL